MRRKPVKRRWAKDDVRELVLYAESSSEPVYRMLQSIHANLVNKVVAGKYDPKKAPRAFRHAADLAAKEYTREFNAPARDPRYTPSGWNRATAIRTRGVVGARSSFGTFTPVVRDRVAKHLLVRFLRLLAAGELWDLLNKTNRARVVRSAPTTMVKRRLRRR